MHAPSPYKPAGYDPETQFHELERAADAMIEAMQDARLTEELQKPRLASLTLQFMRSSKSRVEAETQALASPDYEEYIRGMVAAGVKYERARARYRNLQVLAEARRTEQASIRALTR